MFELNKEVLCESCEKKKIEKLTNKYGNEEIARLLYESKLNSRCRFGEYIRWIPFDEFKNIEYLVKGGFGEVHKATWITYSNQEVVPVKLWGEINSLKFIYYLISRKY